ncbi:MAG: hypothetical protein NC079_07370 [Clostridium sp.]|nr:hypothetical protein [Acetatifactor muris]MCM1527100.1 hypothetical protein [Bacteroides sp.]MCM1563415.1 hypothetical protein [Clostridium sp.]
MNKKVTSIFAYLGLLFWLIGFLAGDKEGAKFHLNQGLVLAIANIVLGVVAIIPFVGAIISCIGTIATFVFMIMGIVSACKDEEKPLPLIGKIQLLK